MKKMVKRQKIKETQKLAKTFFDRNLLLSSNKKRIRRSLLGLQFLEKGAYQVTERRAEVKNEV